MWHDLYVITTIINLGLGILFVSLLIWKEPDEPKTTKTQKKETDEELIDFIDEAVKDKPRQS